MAAPIARPMLFSAPMVRALLDGRKTQTRRVLKPQPEDHLPGEGAKRARAFVLAPFDRGDRLWVREAACVNYQSWHHKNGYRHGLTYKAGGGLGEGIRAGEAPTTFPRISHNRDGRLRFASPIHMPRWASRLTLTVTDVRVQRVQDISEEDAIREGVALSPDRRPHYRVELTRPNSLGVDAVDADRAASCFRRLWDSLNAKRGFGWDANPWVVALTFTVEHRNIDAGEQHE